MKQLNFDFKALQKGQWEVCLSFTLALWGGGGHYGARSNMVWTVNWYTHNTEVAQQQLAGGAEVALWQQKQAETHSTSPCLCQFPCEYRAPNGKTELCPN